MSTITPEQALALAPTRWSARRPTSATPPAFATHTATEIKKNALAFGYAIGAGVDVALMPNLFLRGEYEFVGLPISHMQISLHNFRVGAGLKF
jgi:opacity protein-like surface antigen